MLFTTITNCRLCRNGKLTEGERLVFSEDNGEFLEETGYIGGEIIDLDDGIIAPGFLELQTNGVNGFHFTHYENDEIYSKKIEETAKFYLSQGVTAFWATIPTVSDEVYKKVYLLLIDSEHSFLSTFHRLLLSFCLKFLKWICSLRRQQYSNRTLLRLPTHKNVPN